MDPKVTDINQTLSYHAKALNRHYLKYGPVMVGLGAFLLYVTDPTDGPFHRFMLVALLGFGGALTLYALFQTFVAGKPALVLSPQGVRLRAHVEWGKDMVIPWSAVKGLDTADIEGRFRGSPVRYEGVTVLLVTRAFYDRNLHVNSWLLRGPSWDFYFIPVGEMVQVALHHVPLSIKAEEVRAAVEARWKAFRETS